MQNSPPEVRASVLRLTLVNERSELERARLALLAFLDGRGVSKRAMFKLELVLEETLMNLIWHAYPQGGRHEIGFAAEWLGDAVELRFVDDGAPFDPLRQPLPGRPQSIEEAVPGGLGLLLTRKTVSAAEYERAEGRNRLSLRIALEG